MSKLATIRDLFGPRENGGYCECSRCVAGRELLAVVEAELAAAEMPMARRVESYYSLASVPWDEEGQRLDLGIAKAWRALLDPSEWDALKAKMAWEHPQWSEMIETGALT